MQHRFMVDLHHTNTIVMRKYAKDKKIFLLDLLLVAKTYLGRNINSSIHTIKLFILNLLKNGLTPRINIFIVFSFVFVLKMLTVHTRLYFLQ